MTKQIMNQSQDPRTDNDLAGNKIQHANTSDSLNVSQQSMQNQNLQQTQTQSQAQTSFPMPKGYQMSAKGVYVDSVKSGWKYVCPYMGMVARYKNLATGTEFYELEYKENSQGQSQRLEVESSIFSRTGIEELLTKGVVFPSAHKNQVIDYLTAQKSLLKPIQVSSDAGWEEVPQSIVQASSQSVNPNTTAFWSYVRLSRDGVEGINDGTKYDLKPAGTSQAWLKLYNEEVAGNIPLEFGVVLGLSASLVPILTQWTPDFHNLFCHIVGQSTTGKTTVAALAASVAGRPTSADHGLLRTWSTTQNALTIMLNGNHGVPLVLDELSMVAKGDLTSLVYQLADGSEKSRATQSASLKKARTWSTSVVSTGELKITDRINQNDGLLVRILELEGVQFTSSAEQSERIKREVAKNYGWATPEFVSRLQRIELVELHKEYEEAIALVNEELADSKFKARLASKLAVFPLVARLTNEFWGWSIVPRDLVQFIVAHTSEDWTVPIGQRALNTIIPYLIGHQRDIKVGKDSANVSNHLIGSMRLEGQRIVINILKPELLKIFEELGFQDTATILKQWKANGTLESELDRKTRRVEIDGQRRTAYPIVIPDTYLDQFYLLKASTMLPKYPVDDIDF